MDKTVLIDFDGVIHSYTSGWQGANVIPDPPVEGIRDEIIRIREAGYKVVIFSSRVTTGELLPIIRYLDKHDVPFDGITDKKVPAVAMVDDRAICFDGQAKGLLEKIEAFVPWIGRRKV